MKGFERGYCKYCCKRVGLEFDGDNIVCRECWAGLAPLDIVNYFHSFNKWFLWIEKEFNEKHITL